MVVRKGSARRRLVALLRRRITRPVAEHQVAVILALWMTTIVLGMIGWAQNAANAGERVPAYLLYVTLQLFPLKSGDVPGYPGWPLELARWLAPIVVVLVAGKGLSVLFYRQFQFARASLMRDHVVVCGLGQKGEIITRTLLEQGFRVVVIEQKLSSSAIDGIRGEGAIVLEGDARRPSVLKAAQVQSARRIIALCDDATNAEIAVQARECVGASKQSVIECLAHVGDPDRLEALYRLSDDLASDGRIRLRFFSLPDAGAREMLRECPPFGIDPQTPVPEITVMGSGKFAERFLLALAERWAVRCGMGRDTLSVTLVAADAATFVARMTSKYPALFHLCTVTPVDSDPADFGAEKTNATYAEAAPVGDKVFVLDETEADAVEAAAFARSGFGPEAAIVVLTRTTGGFARLLAQQAIQDRPAGGFSVFPLYERTCSGDGLVFEVEIEAMAMHLSEEYVAITGSIDPRARWESMPQRLKDSNRHQARWMPEILSAEGYRIVPSGHDGSSLVEFAPHEIERMANREHRRWAAERILGGWVRSDGKSIDERMSPYLVPWEALDATIKEIDRRFVTAWPRLLAQDGLVLVCQPSD